MAICVVEPCSLKGKLLVPPSKSMGHRALFCAALANGSSCIDNLVLSEDISATISALLAFGIPIKLTDSTRYPGRLRAEVTGKGSICPNVETINCHESGSTARFIIPFSRLSALPVTITGVKRLLDRPFGLFRDLLSDKGVMLTLRDDNCLPITLEGRLSSGIFRLKGNVSSQFITGLLFALPLLEGDSEILVEGILESAPYVEMTIEMLSVFGVEACMTKAEKGEGDIVLTQSIKVGGGQKFLPANYDVEGDWSQAAFWALAGALGHDIKLEGLRLDSLQGDRVVIDILSSMGAKIIIDDACISVAPFPHLSCNSSSDSNPACSNKDCSQEEGSSTNDADTRKISNSNLTIDVSQCPDLVPALATAAAFANGRSQIVNAARLRLKESDRLSATTQQLQALGADIVEFRDGLVVNGLGAGDNMKLAGGIVDGCGDHRIVMAAAIASTRTKVPVTISGMEAVNKSYPDFWVDFKRLGGVLYE